MGFRGEYGVSAEERVGLEAASVCRGREASVCAGCIGLGVPRTGVPRIVLNVVVVMGGDPQPLQPGGLCPFCCGFFLLYMAARARPAAQF